MRVILTRPADQAGPWLQGLRAAGLDAQAWPLIEIRPTRHPAALQAARAQAGQYQALMFVSTNAVTPFLMPDMPVAGEKWTWLAMKNIANGMPAPRCWATGPGTAQALQQAGVPAQSIDAPGPGDTLESEALWAVVREQVRPGVRVLLVRGANAQGQVAGRSWLAEQLAAAGAQVSELAAYERHPPVWGGEQVETANQALQDGSVWLWSSSEALANLPALPALALGQARAVATHPRIAQAALERGFALVRASRPELPALLRSIQSFA